MSIVKCEDCGKFVDLDIEDCSYSDDNTYLCENCSNKPSEIGHRKATREEIKQHHQEEYDLGIL